MVARRFVLRSGRRRARVPLDERQFGASFDSTCNMPSTRNKSKLRWWQFSLRTFLVLVTLFSVLAVVGYRYREWGRELSEERWWKSVIIGGQQQRLGVWYREPFDVEEFDRKYWLPLNVYKLTSWDYYLGNKYVPPAIASARRERDSLLRALKQSAQD